MAIVSGVSVLFGTWIITEMARKRISKDDFAGVLIKFYIFLDVLAFAEGMHWLLLCMDTRRRFNHSLSTTTSILRDHVLRRYCHIGIRT